MNVKVLKIMCFIKIGENNKNKRWQRKRNQNKKCIRRLSKNKSKNSRMDNMRASSDWDYDRNKSRLSEFIRVDVVWVEKSYEWTLIEFHVDK